MPATNSSRSEMYIVTKNGADAQAQVLQRRAGEAYVHYANTDKRMDEWISESDLHLAQDDTREDENGISDGSSSKKRKRGSTSHSPPRQQVLTRGRSSTNDAMTEEEYDIQHHKQITAHRNFDRVNFGRWQIKTWYFSPYPLTETEGDDTSTVHGPSSSLATPRIPGVSRSTVRSHGRTSDLLAGGLGRTHGLGEKAILWVCDRCFKYMADGLTWELHVKNCSRKHPPGRKVYQRGAHTIWEVDGAKEKVFCQNLSLFGKLFIDVKTLFFDCDSFLFYILTDADSKRDHVLGFFSKEKHSYDDYNLACIVTLPPYQRRGYGMLMIEFSYELSRRSRRVGTPERPLSDLGLRSYLAFWVATIVRFLRRLLSVVPPESPSTFTVAGGSEFTLSASLSEDEVSTGVYRTRGRRAKGPDGEPPKSDYAVAPMGYMNDPLFMSMRTVTTTANADGSATSQASAKCTLADIARATGLRVEDAAFALSECGLLTRRVKSVDGNDSQGGNNNEVVVITREMVEAVATERGVKKMCMELGHVLLPVM